MARELVPAFQFYPKDFLSDGKQAAMSLAEVGAYIRLLSICWLEHSIPDDVVRVARMVGVTPAQMRRIWPAVRSCFKSHPDDASRLIHSRLERERLNQEAYRARQADNGRKGGRPKATPEANRNPPLTQVEAKQEAKKSSPSPSPTPDRSPERARENESARGWHTAGVMAGTLPRDHLNCRPPCVRVCLTQKQHVLLRERHGGTDADLDAFYAEVRANLHGPVGQKPWDFWESQFNARFGPPAVANSRTAGNLAAARRWLENSGVKT